MIPIVVQQLLPYSHAIMSYMQSFESPHATLLSLSSSFVGYSILIDVLNIATPLLADFLMRSCL